VYTNRDTQCPNRTCAYFCAATASLSFPNLVGDAVCNNLKSYFPPWFSDFLLLTDTYLLSFPSFTF
jgi:hypothetical protein